MWIATRPKFLDGNATAERQLTVMRTLQGKHSGSSLAVLSDQFWMFVWFVLPVDSRGQQTRSSWFKSINQSFNSYQQTYSVLSSEYKNSKSHNTRKGYTISEDISLIN
jgi:hypothetical protein